MALPITNMWEVENGGADTNGGGFDPANANMLTDGAATSATGASPSFTSASYSFVAGDAGAWLFIQSGTNWIPGWYKISSVAGGAATLDATAGHGVLYAQMQVSTATGCATTASPTSAVWSIDYSQQAAAQFAYTDLAIDAVTNTKLTSAAHPFGKQQVGNTVQVTGGTGFTTGYYSISSVTSTTATMDRAVGTTGSTGGTGNQGGALATPAQAVNTAMVGKNTVWIQYNAVVFTTSAVLTPPAGNNDAPSSVVGYTTYRGDITGPTANMPTIQLSAASGNIFTLSNVVTWLRNLILDANSKTTSRCVNISGAQCLCDNLVAKNFTDYGITAVSNSNLLMRCWATANGTGATAGLYSGSTDNNFIRCATTNTSCKGIRIDSNPSDVAGCVFANNSGATSDGIYVNSAQSVRVDHCVCYNNGRSGVYLGAAGASNTLLVFNSIFAKNAAYGIDNQTGTATLRGCPLADYNFFWSNTSGPRNNFAAGTHDVAGTGDPFATPAGTPATLADVWTNFGLNSTSGAGAAARAAAYPAYADQGAVQHQDTGGGGTGGANLLGAGTLVIGG